MPSLTLIVSLVLMRCKETVNSSTDLREFAINGILCIGWGLSTRFYTIGLSTKKSASAETPGPSSSFFGNAPMKVSFRE